MLMYVNKSDISEDRVPSDLSSCTRLEYRSRSLSESDSAPACQRSRSDRLRTGAEQIM